MDSEKIIIYVIIGIVYYGYRYFFKNFGTSKNTPKNIDPPVSNSPVFPEKRRDVIIAAPQDPRAEKSIFDLLEEIKRQEKGSERQLEYQRPSETTKSLETTDYELEPQKVVIENTNPYQYASSNIGTEVSGPTKKYDSEEYAIRKKPHPLLTALKNPKKVKEAFIIGEILTKRY